MMTTPALGATPALESEAAAAPDMQGHGETEGDTLVVIVGVLVPEVLDVPLAVGVQLEVLLPDLLDDCDGLADALLEPLVVMVKLPDCDGLNA